MVNVFDLLKILLFAAVFVLGIHYFFLESYYVSDNTMSPLLHAGDLVIVSRLSHFTESYKRNDVILMRLAGNLKERVIRKIIGMPGEKVKIEAGFISIRNDAGSHIKEIPIFGDAYEAVIAPGKLDIHEYFVIGESPTSKGFGLIDKRFIIGKPILRIWPYNRIGFL